MSSSSLSNLYNPFWQQTMLRIKDPKVSVAFYEKHFGFTLIDEYHFPSMSFSLYFLATFPQEEVDKLKDVKPGSEVFGIFSCLFFLYFL
jgi:lactoylglutathione lyase